MQILGLFKIMYFDAVVIFFYQIFTVIPIDCGHTVACTYACTVKRDIALTVQQSIPDSDDRTLQGRWKLVKFGWARTAYDSFACGQIRVTDPFFTKY